MPRCGKWQYPIIKLTAIGGELGEANIDRVS